MYARQKAMYFVLLEQLDCVSLTSFSLSVLCQLAVSIIDFSIIKYDFLLITSLSTCNPCSEFTYHMQVPSRSYELFLKIFSFNTIFFVTVRCIKSTGSIIWDMMKKSEMRCIYFVNDSEAYWYFNYLEERNNSYLVLGLVLALCFCFESTWSYCH